MPETEKTKEEVAAYNREYYEQNKPILKITKAKRYATDRKYREGVKRRARDRYQKKRGDALKNVGYTLKKLNGEVVFTIQHAAKAIGRATSTLRSAEASGHVPKSTVVDSRGWRVYTERQIGLMVTAFKYYDENLWTMKNVSDYLHKHWEEPK